MIKMTMIIMIIIIIAHTPPLIQSIPSYSNQVKHPSFTIPCRSSTTDMEVVQDYPYFSLMHSVPRAYLHVWWVHLLGEEIQTMGIIIGSKFIPTLPTTTTTTIKCILGNGANLPTVITEHQMPIIWIVIPVKDGFAIGINLEIIRKSLRLEVIVKIYRIIRRAKIRVPLFPFGIPWLGIWKIVTFQVKIVQSFTIPFVQNVP
mmetsp:Transcript_16693/g.23664  ORF Transcript_16693/g.23664 Transcript_16693/m.23664 type:complete len:202 (-) Transcript_16693:115-720(-)